MSTRTFQAELDLDSNQALIFQGGFLNQAQLDLGILPEPGRQAQGDGQAQGQTSQAQLENGGRVEPVMSRI